MRLFRLLSLFTFVSLCLLTILADGAWAIRLISEDGFRHGSKFYHNGDGGHAYHYNLDTPTSIYFKCVMYQTLKCSGRAILRLGGGFRHSKPHNHDPDPDYVGFRHFRQNVVNQVANARRYVTYQQIIDEARQDRRYSRNVRKKMTLRRLRSPLYRARMGRYPPIPQTLRDLTRLLLSNNNISKTVDESQNMYAGSVTARDGSHVVAFFSPRMLNWMSQLKLLQSDGTFRARPALPQSSQCFVLVTTWRNVVIPLGWFLMERRTFAAYRACFGLLKQLCPNLNPETVVTDWEYAQQRAWEAAFPNARLQGCLWHLCRAYIKKARKLRLMRYRGDVPAILTYIRKACAIALLPPQFFQDGLRIIMDDVRQEDQLAGYLLRHFFQYVQGRWINNQYRREWMSLYGSVTRTNNACETHNKMLRTAVGAYRPNIFVFIEALAQLEHNTDLDVSLMNEEASAKRKRGWKSILADETLEALRFDLEMDLFHDRDIPLRNYLNKASHLYQTAFNEEANR